MNRTLKLASVGLIAAGLPFVAFAQGVAPQGTTPKVTTTQGTTSQGTLGTTTRVAPATTAATSPAGNATTAPVGTPGTAMPDAKAGTAASMSAPSHGSKVGTAATMTGHLPDAKAPANTTASMTSKPLTKDTQAETPKAVTHGQPATAATGSKS